MTGVWEEHQPSMSKQADELVGVGDRVKNVYRAVGNQGGDRDVGHFSAGGIGTGQPAYDGTALGGIGGPSYHGAGRVPEDAGDVGSLCRRLVARKEGGQHGNWISLASDWAAAGGGATAWPVPA